MRAPLQCAVLLSILASPAFGQGSVRADQAAMRFDHVSVDEGLSNFTPTVIAQDNLGFLWIGTEDGLNRYDGHTFRSYRPKMGDSTALDGGIIFGVVCDRDGDVWVSAFADKLFRYDRRIDAFERFAIPVRSANLQLSSDVRMQSHDGLLWITSNDGVYTVDPRTRQIRCAVHRSTHPALTSNTVLSATEDNSGNIWLGTDRGIDRFDPRGNSITPYPLKDLLSRSAGYGSVLDLQCDSAGTLWAATGGGLLRYDPATDAFERAPFGLLEGKSLGAVRTQDLYLDRHGILWVATIDYGLVALDPERNTVRQYVHDDRDPHSLYNNRIQGMFEDRSGVLWVGNYRAGLNRYERRLGRFASIPTQGSVYALLEDSRGALWLGSIEGLSRAKMPPAAPDTSLPGVPAEVRRSSVYALAEDSRGDLWVGQDHSITRIPGSGGRARTYLSVSADSGRSPFSGYVKSLCIDPAGDVWAGVDQSELLLYDRTKDVFRPFRARNRAGTVQPIRSVWSIWADAQGGVWFATFGDGLFRYEKPTAALTHWTSSAGDSTSLPQNAVYFVRQSADGSIWVGTFGGGAARFDGRAGRFRRYSVEDGLPDSFVKGMLEDAGGNLWFSTDKGISRFDPRAGSFLNFREKDGLHSNVFLSGSYARGRNGEFYFGGEHGVTMFRPESIRENEFAPSVVITSFKVLDRAKPPLGGLVADTTAAVMLGYAENFFSFEFASDDFTAPDRNQFSYRLEGLDPDWVHSGTRRYATYAHVPAGDYTFRVRGTNSDGVWSPKTASLRVIVVPPPWERLWFRALAVLALAGIAVGLYNYRVNRLLEIERLRVRIASDLHDDIGASLTKISLQSELIQENIEPAEQQNYIKSIAAMSRELVTAMGDIVWSIDSRNDSTGDLLDKMRSFGSAALSPKDISFTLSQSGLDPKKKLSVDVRENLYLIYKEAVNNIVKHAGAQRVSVVLQNDADTLTMTIADDGTGWEGTERPSGHGVKNMRMRAERLGGTVRFVRERGTRVILTMRRL